MAEIPEGGAPIEAPEGTAEPVESQEPAAPQTDDERLDAEIAEFLAAEESSTEESAETQEPKPNPLDLEVQKWMDKQAEAQAAKERYEARERELEQQAEAKAKERFKRFLEEFRYDPHSVIKEAGTEVELDDVVQDLLGATAEEDLTGEQRTLLEVRRELRRLKAEQQRRDQEAQEEKRRRDEQAKMTEQQKAAEEFAQNYVAEVEAKASGSEGGQAGYLGSLLKAKPEVARRLIREHGDRLADQLAAVPPHEKVIAEVNKYLEQLAPAVGAQPSAPKPKPSEEARGVLSSIDNLDRIRVPEPEIDLDDDDALHERAMRAMQREEERLARLYGDSEEV